MVKRSKRVIIDIIIIIGLIVASFIANIPFEIIYIRESKPIEFLPGTKPYGLIEASNNYVILSYGTLLKQNKEEFFVQFLKFDTNENAFSYFFMTLEGYRNAGIKFELNSSGEDQKAIICEEGNSKKECALLILSKEKIFYFMGDKTKIKKVIEWFMNRKV